MKFKKCTFKGITLTELLVTLIVGTLFLGIVLSSWYFTYKNWSIERIRARLRIDLAVVMERIKEEMRLSSLTYTSFYPSDSLEYTAISFPMANADTNDSRFLNLDNDGFIEWYKSVIYHVFENPPDSGNYELRRTEFTNNYAYLQDETDRDKQLSDLVQYGEAQESTPNEAKATEPETILKSIDSFTIKSQSQLFDGYSSTIQISEEVNFGNVKLDYGEDGYHDFKFEVVGKNASSSDRKFGIDVLSITPSGCPREAEFYYPLSSPHSDSGGTPSKGDWAECSGKQYLEYSSGDIADYVNLHIYYDLWRESDFDDSDRVNTILTTDDLYIKLKDLGEGNDVVWTAEIEAGSGNGNAVKADYNDGGGNPKSLAGITIRNLVSYDALDASGDLVRVQFDSHSSLSSIPLRITAAYIDERESVLNPVNDGAVDDEDAVDPAVLSPPGSETRIQLYFTTDPTTGIIVDSGTGDITPGGIIPAGQSKYTNWAIFPIVKDETDKKDYFITFYIFSGNASYWDGTDSNHTNSYLSYGNHAADASWDEPDDKTSENPPVELPQFDPPGPEYTSSRHIYAQASLEIWSKEGAVTSRIYDTTLSAPNYDKIGWTESTDADISVSAGSSDDDQMAGATWDLGSDVNPHSLSIGSGRYARFEATLSTIPYWTCIDHSAVSVSDADYKDGTTTTCTEAGCIKRLISAVNCPWIDNVTINWPGESKMCEISAYFMQKPDYGIIKLTVDGQELAKGLEFSIAISEELQDKIYETSLTSEIEPRNTGR